MVVETQEGHRYTIGYGFGFEVQRIAGGRRSGDANPNGTTLGASPRGIFEIARSKYVRAGADSFVSGARQHAGIPFCDHATPRTISSTNHNLSLQLTGFAEKTQDINTFTSTRFEGGAQLVEKLSPSSSLLYRYFYRRVKAANLARSTRRQIPLLSQPTLVSGFGLTYARDRRDNPADAKHGNFNTFDVS